MPPLQRPCPLRRGRAVRFSYIRFAHFGRLFSPPLRSVGVRAGGACVPPAAPILLASILPTISCSSLFLHSLALIAGDTPLIVHCINLPCGSMQFAFPTLATLVAGDTPLIVHCIIYHAVQCSSRFLHSLTLVSGDTPAVCVCNPPLSITAV